MHTTGFGITLLLKQQAAYVLVLTLVQAEVSPWLVHPAQSTHLRHRAPTYLAKFFLGLLLSAHVLLALFRSPGQKKNKNLSYVK